MCSFTLWISTSTAGSMTSDGVSIIMRQRNQLLSDADFSRGVSEKRVEGGLKRCAVRLEDAFDSSALY
jgi:hypothetical protein